MLCRRYPGHKTEQKESASVHASRCNERIREACYHGHITLDFEKQGTAMAEHYQTFVID